MVAKPGLWHEGHLASRNSFGCMAGLILTVVCVAAAGLLVVRQWQAWVRADQQLTKHHINPELAEFKGSVGSCSRVLCVSFSCVH